VLIDENEERYGNFLFVDASDHDNEKKYLENQCDVSKGHTCTWDDK
jgi:hypothetical protein